MINSILITLLKIFHSEIFLEIIKTSPAWIALIISLVVPFITKKLDIEKANKLFIFNEKFRLYLEHFDKLYNYNNNIIEVFGRIK